MKRASLVLVTLFSFSIIVFGSLSNLLDERLSQDVQYLQALKTLNQAQQRLSKDENWFTPYFDLDTDVVLVDEEFRLQVQPRFSFDINGWGIHVLNNLSVNSEGADWSGWSFELSRDLFQSEKIEDLEDQASYLEALWSVKNSRNRVFKNLVSEIFNSWIARQKLQLLREELEIRQRIYEEEVHCEGITVSKEELNTARKVLLSLEGNLEDLERQLLGKVEVDEPLLEETVEILESLVGAQTGEDIQREDIKALELRLKAAKEEKDRSFLKYLPTPTFSIRWFENPAPGQGEFSIGIFLDSLLDRGERNTNVKNIDLNYRIALANYQNTHDDLEDQLQNLEMAIASLETSQEIAKIDLEMAQTDLEKARRRFEEGFITEDELRLAEIEVMKRELDVKQIHFDTLITQLELQILHGVDLVGLLEVER